MTSKQLINQLCYEYNTKNYNEEKLKTTQEIKKDLEVLEIIKEHKLLNYVLKNKKCANMYHLSKEECDLLKEWYENGKTNNKR